MELQPYQQRVIAELNDLEDKLEKLSDFITGEKFDSLPKAERGRLVLQNTLMNAYAIVLTQRIDAF